METRTVRRPGGKGTHSLMQKYGERPICIRYRSRPGAPQTHQDRRASSSARKKGPPTRRQPPTPGPVDGESRTCTMASAFCAGFRYPGTAGQAPNSF
ncbi:MAG: hypothetical protein MZV65_12450 [Chromatiales bacterium]|nr:hypothetical protein [Chromatiales bacterium]